MSAHSLILLTAAARTRSVRAASYKHVLFYKKSCIKLTWVRRHRHCADLGTLTILKEKVNAMKNNEINKTTYAKRHTIPYKTTK